jgi:hypothetical protein
MENTLRQLRTVIEADTQRIRQGVSPPPDPNADLRQPMNRFQRRKVKSVLRSKFGLKARTLRRT